MDPTSTPEEYASCKALSQTEAQKKRHAAILATVMAAASLITQSPAQTSIPLRTSILTGQLWIDELLDGHPTRFLEQFGMTRDVFCKLSYELQTYSGLANSKYVTADEQLAFYLHLARTGLSSRMLQERFQRSGDTISVYIHRIVKMLVGRPFYSKFLHPPLDETPTEIASNPKLYPYFKYCRGSIDGSHFDSWVQEQAIARYRNRKGGITQNVLAVCDFSMKFTYILSGWEGSASDSHIFEYARSRDLTIPPGRYLLADAGFPLCDVLMTPYRGVRYHLKEWSRGNQKPQTPEELFNLRHAQARNVIERIFGVVKRRFGLLKAAPEYSLEMQAMFISSLCALHNFIHEHDPSDDVGDDIDLQYHTNPNQPEDPQAIQPDDLGFQITSEERNRASIRRDKIAKKMWDDYQLELARRGIS